MNSNSKYIDWRDHLLVFLLIANSGLPFFANQSLILLGSFLFSMVFINPVNVFKNRLFTGTLLILFTLIIGQWITTNIFDLEISLTLFIRWIYPFLVLLVVKRKFPKLFVNVMYFLTLISLILFIPSIVFPSFESYLMNLARIFDQQSSNEFYSYNHNILIYTVKPYMAFGDIAIFKRNSGPFWESGGFGAYLILAIIFTIVLKKELLNKFSIIFIVALFTTWSTAALASLSFLLLLYGIWIIKKKAYGFLLVPFVIFSSFSAYKYLPFVAKRIDYSIEDFRQRDRIDYQARNRMVSAIVDFNTFTDYPVFGTGRNFEARFGTKTKTYLEHRNNGLTDFLVKYGLFYFIFYFSMIRKSYAYLAIHNNLKESKRFSILAMVSIFIIGLSQALFQQSVFIGLFYLSSFLRNQIAHGK